MFLMFARPAASFHLHLIGFWCYSMVMRFWNCCHDNFPSPQLAGSLCISSMNQCELLFFFQIPPLSFLFFYCHVWLAVILNHFVLSIFLICFGYFVYFTVLGNTMFILGASRVGWYNARVTNSRVLLVSKLILKFFCSIIYSILYFV